MSKILNPSVVFESRGMPAATAIEAWHDMADNTLDIGIDEGHRRSAVSGLAALGLREVWLEHDLAALEAAQIPGREVRGRGGAREEGGKDQEERNQNHIPNHE